MLSRRFTGALRVSRSPWDSPCPMKPWESLSPRPCHSSFAGGNAFPYRRGELVEWPLPCHGPHGAECVEKNLPPCRGAHKLSQGLSTKSQLGHVQSCSLWRGWLGRKERVTRKQKHMKIPSLLKVRDLHFIDGSIW